MTAALIVPSRAGRHPLARSVLPVLRPVAIEPEKNMLRRLRYFCRAQSDSRKMRYGVAPSRSGPVRLGAVAQRHDAPHGAIDTQGVQIDVGIGFFAAANRAPGPGVYSAQQQRTWQQSCLHGEGHRPKPGRRNLRSLKSTPKPSPSRLNSRPSWRATVTPAKPHNENCQPVPLGAGATKVVGPR